MSTTGRSFPCSTSRMIRVAVKTFAQRALKLTPAGVKVEHVPALLDALRPTLYTLVGAAPTDALLERIRNEVA